MRKINNGNRAGQLLAEDNVYIGKQYNFQPSRYARTAMFIAGVLSCALSLSAQPRTQDDWKFIEEVQQVKFYYRISECTGTPYLLLKVTNESGRHVSGVWKLQLEHMGRKFYYSGILIDLKAGVIQQGNCSEFRPFLMVQLEKIVSADDARTSVTLDVKLHQSRTTSG